MLDFAFNFNDLIFRINYGWCTLISRLLFYRFKENRIKLLFGFTNLSFLMINQLF
jgi:hypothetical protein